MKDKTWGGYYKASLWYKLIRLAILQGSGGGEQWSTVTGAIASFTTLRSAPLKSLVCHINPIQDLHGQDAPYPPGGGINKFNTGAGRQAYSWSDGCGFADIASKVSDITLFGTATSNHTFGLTNNTLTLPSGTYTASISEYNKVAFRVFDNSTSEVIAQSINAPITFTLTAETTVYYDFVIQSGASFGTGTTFRFQLESGSSATTPLAPYSNLCPISGFTGLTAYRTGENLLIESSRTVYGDGNGSRWSYADGFTLKANQTYTFSVSGSEQLIRVYIVDKATGTSIINANTSVTYTPTTDRLVYLQAYRGTAIEDSNVFMLNTGSSADPYKPYTGTTIPVSWQSTAGTVYSGTLDVVSGVLTANGDDDLGSLDWTYRGDLGEGIFASSSLNYLPKSDASAICSSYGFGGVVGSGASANTNGKFYLYYNPSTPNIKMLYIKDTRYSDKTTFTTAVTGQKIVYELAEPLTFQLTPTEVNALQGVNNVWNTAGDTTVEYRSN